MNPKELQDDDLLTQAHEWRLRALRGEKDARGYAHELECEVRLRLPKIHAHYALSPTPRLGIVAESPKRRWRFW